MNDPNNPMLALAIGDLATRIGVSASAINVTSIDEVEWSNGSLGCPKPGLAYTQVIIPGYNIVLEAGGKAYNYHTDMRRQAILCENRPAPTVPQS